MEKIPNEFCVLETIVFNPPQMMYVWFDGSPDKKYLEKVCVYDPRIPGYPVITLSGMSYAHCSFSKDSQGASNNESNEKKSLKLNLWDNFLDKTGDKLWTIWHSYFGGKFEFLAQGPILFLHFFIAAIFVSIFASGTLFYFIIFCRTLFQIINRWPLKYER